jgi:hypothetical protein
VVLQIRDLTVKDMDISRRKIVKQYFQALRDVKQIDAVIKNKS